VKTLHRGQSVQGSGLRHPSVILILAPSRVV
jgi:hypothetical protein